MLNDVHSIHVNETKRLLYCRHYQLEEQLHRVLKKKNF